MKILIDTNVFLWLSYEESALSDEARAVVSDTDNELFVSAVTAWEIAVKHELGKLKLKIPPQEFVPKARDAIGAEPLPIDESAALVLGRLSPIHRDPFDRMLICQAIDQGMVILTSDKEIRKYPVRTIW